MSFFDFTFRKRDLRHNILQEKKSFSIFGLYNIIKYIPKTTKKGSSKTKLLWVWFLLLLSLPTTLHFRFSETEIPKTPKTKYLLHRKLSECIPKIHTFLVRAEKDSELKLQSGLIEQAASDGGGFHG